MRLQCAIAVDRMGGSVALLATTACAVMAACGGSTQSDVATRVDAREPDLLEQLHQGFAFAPTWIPANRRDAAELGAYLTRAVREQVSTDVFLEAGATDIVPAERVRELLPAGPRAEALATLRRQRAAGEPVDAAVAQTVADALGRRLLLATWLAEQDERGAHILNTDQEGEPWPPDGGTVPYTRVRGELVGELIDLQGPRVLWRGVASYGTERGSPARVRAELTTLRQKAVAALSAALVGH